MPEPPLRIGLLDFSWVWTSRSPNEALQDTLTLAARAEALGYSRYWLGEHHVQGHACGSPQVLAGVVAAATNSIRVGVGAMLLHYWAPLKLAEDFRLLETLFGRVDLGVGRGRADSLASHRALLDGRAAGDGLLNDQDYGAKVDDLVGHLRNSLALSHPHAGAPVIPESAAMPEVWICGSAGAARHAARTGARFCCTLFHGGIAPPTHLKRYRKEFRPSGELTEPCAAIAVAGVCAETEAEARAMRDRFPNPNYVPTVVGNPEQCKTRIEQFCAEYEVNEVILLDIAPDRCSRMRSAELLAQALGLGS
ncbi:LLM class flavin-dependent oxidoreductase [Streptomyces paradoxus]|uniref:Luciferase family oxidoreductase group 1 n=1 Tax=Streptomyces paradoxus TaxID=66375 RepID=A0A7W9WMN0_9ACTN|nr:MsnO8 family LLM class oxidoreductase [Streptomyces paradoxus]MBB6081845.1 luciferase family oxidoreductase group 1 [Streptomyces paradoxus]